MKSNKKIILLIIVFIINIIITTNNYATDKIEIENKTLTEDYKKWETLSEEEKKSYMQPLPFSIDLTINEVEQNNQNVKLRSKSLPTKYCLKDDIKLMVRDQKNTGECWAFTTTNLISTNLQKRGLANSFIPFSTRHMNYATSLIFLDGENSKGYKREASTGGNCYLGLNYCTAGYGPVLETQMPFENNANKIYLSKIEGKTISNKINEYIQLPSLYKKIVGNEVVYYNGYSESSTYYKEYSDQEVQTIRNKIKEQVQNNGAVSAYTYVNGTEYFNTNSLSTMKNYYCNDKDVIQNHAVTIVGWDDNYSASNFNSSNRPKNNGAYIVLNSHGSSSYENGYMYISYDDVLIERNTIGIVETSKIDYNNIYQYDELGYSKSVTVESGNTNVSSAYIANVYNKKTNSANKKEYLNEVSFYVPEKSSVTIYANLANSNKSSITQVKSCGELDVGYHTVKLANPLEITGAKFVIAAKYTALDESVNLPMEFNYNSNSNGRESNFWDTATSQSGQSYYSTNKISWTDLENNFSDSNFCIKAFTTETLNTIQANQVGVTYVSHVQDYGWQNWVSDEVTSGTTGNGKRIEALKIKLENAPSNAKITYQAHVQDIGWQDWKSNGDLAGTTGKSKRVEAIKIKLENMSDYTIQYRVHVQDIGWQDWKSDGELAGTTGRGKRIEAIQIRILKKSSDIGVTYVSHVQDIGWQSWVSNGVISGTTGKGKRVEALKIKLESAPSNAKITYQAHVQDIGWQDWKSNGDLAGTTGNSKRVEAIKIKLENMPNYTIQYRVHVQDIGWQGWKSDGELSGTTGNSKRIEAIQIRILEKRN